MVTKLRMVIVANYYVPLSTLVSKKIQLHVELSCSAGYFYQFFWEIFEVKYGKMVFSAKPAL